MAELRRWARRAAGREVRADFVKAVLGARGGLAWVDEARGRLRIAGMAESKVMARVRKILAVADRPLRLSHVLTAVLREPRSRIFDFNARGSGMLNMAARG
jgi:hypothetical protein